MKVPGGLMFLDWISFVPTAKKKCWCPYGVCWLHIPGLARSLSGSMCDTGTEVPTWEGVLRTRRWDVEMHCALRGADAYYVTKLGSGHDAV